MADKTDVAQSRHHADTPRPRLAWLALFQAAIITVVILMSRFARHYTGQGTLEDRLQRLRDTPLDGGVQAIAWDDRSWLTALVAMVGALLLMLPIAWTYVATRERKKVDHSVVATITLLPMAVAVIMVIVQDSLAVAFSLAGIAGLVRFRSALDDTKDAMYVIVAIAVGLGAGVGAMEAAAGFSGLYNFVAIALWWWSAEPPPIAEMALGEQTVPKGRSLLALLPFRRRNRHPEPVAEWLKPGEAILLANAPGGNHSGDTDGNDSGGPGKRDGILRVRAADDPATRRTVEEVLEACTKRWTLESDGRGEDGFPTLTYQVRLKKRCDSEELLAKLQDRLGPELAQYTPAEPSAPAANG